MAGVNTNDASVAVANIASFGHFRFLFAEFPVERGFIVEVHTLMVNMKCGAVFEFEIRSLDSE